METNKKGTTKEFNLSLDWGLLWIINEYVYKFMSYCTKKYIVCKILSKRQIMNRWGNGWIVLILYTTVVIGKQVNHKISYAPLFIYRWCSHTQVFNNPLLLRIQKLQCL